MCGTSIEMFYVFVNLNSLYESVSYLEGFTGPTPSQSPEISGKIQKKTALSYEI
jgi:hypothetical protein